MKEIVLSPEQAAQVAQLYVAMEEQYDQVAAALSFGCTGCPDNCCDSYFQHHTYLEWAYLWLGFRQLSVERQEQILARSREYIVACEAALERDERPQVMCPLNDDGLCSLYSYRLMVCRTHGVPARMTRPDGQVLNFPGCFRCQEQVEEQGMAEDALPRVERTVHLRRLAELENEIFHGQRRLYPRLGLTIAQMLVDGPPSVATPHCER
ncbi:MAG: hypothetical protein H8E79_00885 [Desulfobulbaceae bacterium]|uniref:YkgJ family cysteine cluster protein n=1 Tax=Candidatus Desulfatifera sulfidica TaxID=2841691 RepID=A0A8J6NA82_9BACT|nr:hypothetical protein [Candidatus Desulfatifera sulfidica]